MGGYGFGYYLGVLNPLGNPYLHIDLDVPDSELPYKLGNANLFFALGAVCATLFMGFISDQIGRINLLLLCEVIMVICCGLYSIPELYTFYAVRFVTGMVSAVNQAMSPVVLTEMFPGDISGPMGMVVYISITGSIFASYSWGWFMDQ